MNEPKIIEITLRELFQSDHYDMETDTWTCPESAIWAIYYSEDSGKTPMTYIPKGSQIKLGKESVREKFL